MELLSINAAMVAEAISDLNENFEILKSIFESVFCPSKLFPKLKSAIYTLLDNSVVCSALILNHKYLFTKVINFKAVNVQEEDIF